MAIQSVAAAIHALLLAAHALGLAACWMCAPLFAPDAARVTRWTCLPIGNRKRLSRWAIRLNCRNPK